MTTGHSRASAATGGVTSLPSDLQHARAWHTAALLPDGTVLVWGGMGANGQVVDVGELFHPETQKFELLTATGLTLRASHTATLLTEGRLLIAGGVAPHPYFFVSIHSRAL